MSRSAARECTPSPEAFGKAVKDLRLEGGWSQEELGYRADLDRTYVSGIERGIRNPTLEVICRLARGLGVSPSAIFRAAEES